MIEVYSDDAQSDECKVSITKLTMLVSIELNISTRYRTTPRTLTCSLLKVKDKSMRSSVTGERK